MKPHFEKVTITINDKPCVLAQVELKKIYRGPGIK